MANNNNSALTIIQLNVNSLISKKKRHDLELFLNTEEPHIILLNETKIKSKHLLYFRNYNFIRNDRTQNNGGGTGILIKNNISYTVVPRPPTIQSIESTIIKISSNNHELLIAAVYFTPNTNFPSIHTHDLTELIKLNTHPNSSIIIGGDLNAKHSFWGNATPNQSGEKLFRWFNVNCVTQGLKFLRSDLPTFYRTDTNSYLDIFIVSDNITVHHDQQSFPNLKTIDFESDHRAVELKISLGFRIPRQPPKQIPNYSAVNWTELNEHLNTKLGSLHIPTDRILRKTEIDHILESLQEMIDDTLRHHVPLTTLNYSTQIPLPPNIIRIIKLKNTLRRQLHRNRYTPTSHTIKSHIRNANTIIKQLIQIHYDNHWKTKLSSIQLNHNTFKEINKITKRKTYNKIPNLINPLTNDSTDQPTEKANLLGQVFEDIHSQNNSLGQAWFTNLINEQVHKYIEIHNNPITILTRSNPITAQEHHQSRNYSESLADPSDIKFYIKSRNNKKSAGKDKIPNFALKKLSSQFTQTLTTIINHCYNIGYFPDIWKLAIIAPVQKKGKPPNLPTSYRQISLLSNISKIYEKFLLDKIQNHCEANNLIPKNQFGFRASHSTTHAAVALKTDITTKLNQKTPTVACLLDVEKAFDTTWIEGLIFKLIKLKFNPHLIKTLHSFLSYRSFKVRIENSMSKTYKILAGVPQGSLLGPVLYTLYTSDIPTPPNSLPNPIKSLTYADDIIIYASRKNIRKAEDDLNIYLDQLNTYFNKWKIKINTEKCEAITFKGTKILTKKQKEDCKKLKLLYNNTTIINKKEIKYLGIILTENLKPYKHIKSILQKAIISFNSIKGILHYRNNLQKKIKLTCYKQLIRPILAYGFPVWSDLSSSQMEKLRLFERKILRACTGISRKPDSHLYINNTNLYKEANIKRIDIYMINNCIKYFETAVNSMNPLIKNCADTLELTTDEENKYPVPCNIKHLHNQNKLYNNNQQLIHYHKAIQQTTQHLVYNINQ